MYCCAQCFTKSNMEGEAKDVEFSAWLIKTYPDYCVPGDSMIGMAKKVIEGLQDKINENKVFPYTGRDYL